MVQPALCTALALCLALFAGAAQAEYTPPGYVFDGLLHVEYQKHSGLESEGWSFMEQEQVDHVKSLIRNLPPVSGFDAKPEGCEFNSYVIKKIPVSLDFPERIHVCKGIVTISTYGGYEAFRDEKGLEKYLLTETSKRK